MIFVWGTIGFVFAAFATGYLAITAFGLQRHVPPLAGPFALSLILNNLIVEALVAGGLYTPMVLRPLAGIIVLAALVCLLFDTRLSANQIVTAFSGLRRWFGGLKSRPLVEVVFEAAAVALALWITLKTLGLFTASIGTILQGYDPVVQWNRWAVDWAHNKFPDTIYHYPQLVPVLWSIPYVMMDDSTLQFFSSSFKFVFWLATFDALAFIAWRFKSGILLVSIPLTYALFANVSGNTVFEDYIDVPVAFFALASVAVILGPLHEPRDRKAVAVALLIASGAAMTKQVGLYMLGAVPLLLICWQIEEQRKFAPAIPLAFDLAWKAVIAALLAAPIYVYAVWTIHNGTNASELSYLADEIFEGQTHAGRALAAAKRLASSSDATAIVLLVLGTSLPLWWDRQLRWLLIAVCIPFTLIWAFVFSYDDRNLAMALPFWAVASAFGMRALSTQGHDWIWRGTKGLSRPYPRNLFTAATIGVLLLAMTVLSLHYSKSRLIARQQAIELRELGGEPAVTAAMLALIGGLQNPYRILSEWRWACTFSFTHGDGCARIFPDRFFASETGRITDEKSDDVLFILDAKSLTPPRAEVLMAAGFTHAADVGGQTFFLRKRPR